MVYVLRQSPNIQNDIARGWSAWMSERDASLKDLLAGKIGYTRAPSMYCFGLLELVDVPELIQLAHPTKVELVSAD